MRLPTLIALFVALFCTTARAGDEFLDAMDLLRAGHIREARPIIWKLADAGDCDAQSQLSAMLLLGNGGEPDFEAGLHQLTKAAGQGEPLSLLTMGDLYYNKPGLTNLACAPGHCPSGSPSRDLAVAYKWYLLAEKRNFVEKDKAYNAQVLAAIRSEMTPAEKINGERMAAEWKPVPRLCELRHYY
ncbi:MAG: hypothetical protein WAW54_11365 [Parvibaculum sedimenti]|uniref:hypothetical protein n=1 Tax=Parvibaculum sedimenti TaxID=2608632 RepID=UPI003BB7F4B3